MTLQVQFMTLFLMLCSGLSLGVLFDSFRVLFGQLRLPRWLLPFVDILYWIVATILVFRMLIYSNQGQVRLFIFIGLGMGILLYFSFFSPVIVRLVLFLIQLVRMTIRFMIRTIDILIITPSIALYRFLIIFLGFLVAIAIFLYKIMLQLLYPFWRLLIWMIRPLRKFLVLPTWPKVLAKKVRHLFRRLF